jgi:hypothetical protein
VLGVLQAVASAQTPPTNPPPAPHIEFAGTKHDFGRVEAGDKASHTFIFTNTGTATLEILDAHPGCGCTTAANYDKRVEPGKTGVIPVEFNSTGFGGAFHKAVDVRCNDPARPAIGLEIMGTIWKPIEVTPTSAIFNLLPDIQTNDTKVLKIVNHRDEPLTLSDPTVSNHTFKAELRTVKTGQEYDLLVSFLPPLDPDHRSESIRMKTSSAKSPVLTVNASAVVQPAFTWSPGGIALPPAPLTRAIGITIAIQSNSTNALALSEPGLTVPGAEVGLREVEPGRRFDLGVTFPIGFSSPPNEVVQVRVKTSNRLFPLIKIPVYQTPAPAAAK